VVLVEDQVGSAEGAMVPSMDHVWTKVSERLSHTLSKTTFRVFFGTARPVRLTDEAFIIGVQNDFTRDWIANHCLRLIHDAVFDTIGQERQIQLAVEAHEEAAPAAADGAVTRRASASGVNPRYRFDSFVTGSSNRFAHAAALAVAEAPGQAYNPLLIYGGTGLGKTHLLQAIGHYVTENSSDLSVRYVTSEIFLNDFINSLRDKRIEGFKQRYRTYDLLMVDDIQFFEHKERLQEEFFHTFNSLYEAGRQIVISSDRPTRELRTLEERLRSRFEWGLTTDIQPPDLETRIAILRKRVNTEGIQALDPQLLTFIAERVSTNIRELEGALTRVVAFSSLTGRPMTVDLAQDVLKDVFFPEGERPEVSVERIQRTVIERFGISQQELVGHRRQQSIVYPRQLGMFLCRELTDSSLPKIGKEFGGRDHTTVMHATAKITRLIREKRDVYDLVQDLTADIKQVR
jgi:chromosomal replication initiator protein